MADKLVIGCGYLGERIADLWLQQGHRIYATTRSEAQADVFRQRHRHPIICDVTKPETLAQIPKVDTIVYCVGMDRSAGKTMKEVYVQGLDHILQHIPQPGRFLYVSSTGVYGQTDGEWVDETSETNPIDPSGETVLEAEQLLRSRLPQSMILRFAGIYGPGRILRGDALQQGEELSGVGESWLNLIHVDDGAETIRAVEEQGQAGDVYNVCDDEPVQRRDFFALLAQLLSAPAPKFNGQPGRRPTNRRISNRRIREELELKLTFPSYRDGVTDVLKKVRG